MDCSLPGSSVHGISQQENRSWLPFVPPEALPHPGTEQVYPASPALAGEFFTTEPPGKPPLYTCVSVYFKGQCIQLMVN